MSPSEVAEEDQLDVITVALSLTSPSEVREVDSGNGESGKGKGDDLS